MLLVQWNVDKKRLTLTTQRYKSLLFLHNHKHYCVHLYYIFGQYMYDNLLMYWDHLSPICALYANVLKVIFTAWLILLICLTFFFILFHYNPPWFPFFISVILDCLKWRWHCTYASLQLFFYYSIQFLFKIFNFTNYPRNNGSKNRISADS